MPTYKGTVLSKHIQGLIETDRETLTPGGIDRIYYGDQRIIADGRVVCVEPTRKLRDYKATSMIMQTDFETSIIVYVGDDSGVENVQLIADELTEAIEDLLNIKASPSSLGIGGNQMSGLITYGWVSSTEHGYRIPSSQLIRANRLIFNSMSRTEIYVP